MRNRTAILLIGLLAGLITAATRTPTAKAPAGRRILVLHDMEGLAGQTRPNTFRFDHPEAYPQGQAMLVADLNAVIAGLFEGGATKVDVLDEHGSGNPEPDVIAAQLDPRAKQVFKDHPFRGYVDLVEPDLYDAVVVVGMHAKTGSRGFASHTYTLGMEFLIEGRTITETELVGYSWGRVDVPVIMATGDDRLEQDLATMPWLEFVVTKQALAADSAIPRPVDQVHAEMTASAKRALARLGSMKSMHLKVPITAAMRTVAPASLELLAGVPGVDYRDNMVTFKAKDFGAVYDGWEALVNVATQSYSRVLGETIRSRPDAKAINLEFADRLFQRWMDVESGRYQPPAQTPAALGRRYHGAN